MALTQKEMTAQLEQAIRVIVDVMRSALENEQPAIHKDLTEVRWFDTAEVRPDNGQKVIVRTPTGEVYFLTYPFNHNKYPQWWVLPKDNNQ